MEKNPAHASILDATNPLHVQLGLVLKGTLSFILVQRTLYPVLYRTVYEYRKWAVISLLRCSLETFLIVQIK